MAALDLQEQEQVDAFKAWWKANGNFVIVTLLVFVLAISGWRGWQYYQAKQSNEAVTMYEKFMLELDSKDIKRVNDAATVVMDKYTNTIYGAYTALMAAQVNEQNKDITRAKTQLQWVVDHAKEDTLKDVARLRMAALWIDEKKFAEAEKVLSAQHPAAFDALYADMKGDLFMAQGKNAEALKEYKVAFEKTDSKSGYRNFIQMKMDDLGVTQ